MSRLSGKASQIVLLGTGTPNADPERSGPSLAIVIGETPYLVDFGPGVVRRAAAARRSGIEALEARRLRRAFLTHLHSDHTIGYPDLILTPWVLERAAPLEVYGPEGLQAMTDYILAAYRGDIRERLDGLEPINRTGYRVNVHEIEPGLIYQDENLDVEAFPVKHGGWMAFGYKFQAHDRSIVISGDTAPTETLVEAARGCDVLIHEVYSAAAFKGRSSEWQRYHASVHTSSSQLAEIARRVRPGLLILYHQLFWGVSESDLLAEVCAGYDGRVVSGVDLGVY
ncbi:MAG: MBL fold metallo-hydrolase [Anaerolineales bacterium]|nr:MBL fold metallo-hydrolase [Anaerolineales bacterium]